MLLNKIFKRRKRETFPPLYLDTLSKKVQLEVLHDKSHVLDRVSITDITNNDHFKLEPDDNNIFLGHLFDGCSIYLNLTNGIFKPLDLSKYDGFVYKIIDEYDWKNPDMISVQETWRLNKQETVTAIRTKAYERGWISDRDFCVLMEALLISEHGYIMDTGTVRQSRAECALRLIEKIKKHRWIWETFFRLA